MVVFDIIVNGQVIETIKPLNQRLKSIYRYAVEQIEVMKVKYGNNITIKRRIIY